MLPFAGHDVHGFEVALVPKIEPRVCGDHGLMHGKPNTVCLQKHPAACPARPAHFTFHAVDIPNLNNFHFVILSI